MFTIASIATHNSNTLRLTKQSCQGLSIRYVYISFAIDSEPGAQATGTPDHPIACACAPSLRSKGGELTRTANLRSPPIPFGKDGTPAFPRWGHDGVIKVDPRFLDRSGFLQEAKKICQRQTQTGKGFFREIRL